MKAWEVNIKAKNRVGYSSSYKYVGVAKTAEVAVRQTRRLAKKEFTCIEIGSVVCLGDLDFHTGR